MAERIRALPPAGRWILGLGVLLLGLNVVGFALDRVFGGASEGPAASSYTTDGGGVAAYAELLQRDRREVERLRQEPSSASLDASDTLFVLAPEEVTNEDADAVASFVRQGGRLVVATADEPGWLGGIVDDPPSWTAIGHRSVHVYVPVAETAGVDEVVGDGTGAWSDAGSTLPILGDSTPTVTAAEVGEGRVLLLADPSVLQNEFLDRGDNAAFGLAVAGERERAAVFAETFHGYEEARGFAALPSNARWTLLLLAVVTAVVILSSVRRFGPADRHRRDLPPARRGYVDALAASLTKMKDKEAAVQPLRARARAALARHVGLREHATDEELLEAARAMGRQAEAEVLLKPVRDERDVVALGRAAVRSIRGMT
jgi:hypothetical protein